MGLLNCMKTDLLKFFIKLSFMVNLENCFNTVLKDEADTTDGTTVGVISIPKCHFGYMYSVRSLLNKVTAVVVRRIP